MWINPLKVKYRSFDFVDYSHHFGTVIGYVVLAEM